MLECCCHSAVLVKYMMLSKLMIRVRCELSLVGYGPTFEVGDVMG